MFQIGLYEKRSMKRNDKTGFGQEGYTLYKSGRENLECRRWIGPKETGKELLLMLFNESSPDFMLVIIQQD